MKKQLLSIFLIMILCLIAACDHSTTKASTMTTTTNQTMTTSEVTETTSETTQTTTETATTIETTFPTTELSIEATVLGLEGSGTLEDPYLMQLQEKDSKASGIRMNDLSYSVTFTLGTITDQSFTPSDVTGISIDGSGKFNLLVSATVIGTYAIAVTIQETMTLYIVVEVLPYEVDFSQSLKVLAIGNSFSVDAMEYLYQIADNYGIDEIILGILYIPGASLATHIDSITNNLDNYVYYKNTTNQWTYYNSTATLLDGLTDEDWDVITLQQVSGDSGRPATYDGPLEQLIEYVENNKTNSSAKLMWHMTWAYQEDSTHYTFSYYSNDQDAMYQAIVSTVQEKIVPNDAFEKIIPSGTAIQNLRTSFLGDTLTRDGYHLSYDIGRFTAGLTWFQEITGFSVYSISYFPPEVTSQEFLAIKEAVTNAIAHPFEVTNSTYT